MQATVPTGRHNCTCRLPPMITVSKILESTGWKNIRRWWKCQTWLWEDNKKVQWKRKKKRAVTATSLLHSITRKKIPATCNFYEWQIKHCTQNKTLLVCSPHWHCTDPVWERPKPATDQQVYGSQIQTARELFTFRSHQHFIYTQNIYINLR